MATLKIQFSIDLVENELSEREEQPHLSVFLTRHFNRKPIRVGLNVKNAVVTGTLPKDQNEIPQTAALVLSHFAWRYNKVGVRCLMDVGTSHIYLKDIIGYDSRVFNDIPLVMHTVGNIEKAKIKLTVVRVSSGDIRVVNRDLDARHLAQQINSEIQVESRMRDTIQGTENMRVHYNMSESGMELVRGTPSLAYIMSETPQSSEEFWGNGLSNVMIRDGLHRSEFYKLENDIEGEARIFAQLICYLPQYLDYVADTVDRNKPGSKYDYKLVEGCENFGDSLSTYSGDCEDLGTGILMCFNAFMACEIKNKDLRKLQSIGKQYIPFLSLDAVNGQQVKDKNAPKGAHMNDNLVPFHMFRNWIDDPDLEHMYPSKIDERLPFLVGEGTGMLEPLGVDDPKQAIKAYVYRCRSLERFKKPISRSRKDPGGFLVASLNGFTDYFIKRGKNIGSVIYTTKHPDNSVTRGAFYSDMINERRDVGMVMHKPIDTKTMAVMLETTMYRDPPHDLLLDNDHHEEHENNKYLDKIVKKINGKEKVNSQYVPIYVRPHQLDKGMVRDIVRDFKRLQLIWKIDYKLERITNEIWGYRVRVHVNPK